MPKLMARKCWRAGILLLTLLAGCNGSDEPVNPAADGLESLLIRFSVDALPQAPFIDLAAAEVYFSFEGDMFASAVDPQTGRITGHGDKPLGHFGPALVAFHVDPSKPITSSEFLTFRCVRCTIQFEGGPNNQARLRPLLPGDDPNFPDPVVPAEPKRTLAFDVPLQGRFLQNLGALKPQSDLTLGIGLRGVGCGGTQEVRGKGLLAGGRGTICMNGQFDFATPDPNRLASILALFTDGDPSPQDVEMLLTFLASSTLRGQSDCAITLHRPSAGGLRTPGKA